MDCYISASFVLSCHCECDIISTLKCVLDVLYMSSSLKMKYTFDRPLHVNGHAIFNFHGYKLNWIMLIYEGHHGKVNFI